MSQVNTINVDWKIFKSGYYTKAIILTDQNGKPIDITDYKFYFTVKNSIDDADVAAIHQESWTSHLSPTEGSTSFEFLVSETDAISNGQYVYDICFLDDSSPKKKYIIITGNLIVQIPVTKSTT